MPAGTYALQALHLGCTSAQASVTVTGDVQQTLSLSSCDALTRADLAVTLGGSANPAGGQPYPLPAAVRNRGTASSLAGQVVVRRLDPTGSAPLTLLAASLPALCPGQERAYSAQDPSPAEGRTYTYTLQSSVSDADNGNNLASRTVGFAYRVVASQPIAPDPGPVAISSFAVRGGLPHVTVNRAVPLNATATGEPTEYRATLRQVDCPTSLARARWQSWSASSPPQWSFTATGSGVICLQLRRGSGETAVLSSFGSDGIRVVDPTFTSALMGNAGLAPGFPVPGPGPTRLTCGSQFAVGIDARAGLFVDAIALRCADLGEAGEHSGAITTDFVGGPGGATVNLRCRSGEVLTMVDVQYAVYINRLSVYCRPWRRDSGAIGERSPRGTAGGSGTGLVSTDAACTAALGVNALPRVYLRGGTAPGTGPFLAALDIACAAPSGL